MTAGGYVGRFAPTPSGPLHLGSLLTATASWLDARARNGRWLLRIDDVDAPRQAPDAEAAILRSLRRHGLAWDGPVVRQSGLRSHHRAALRRLGGHVFACRCARRELRGLERYPGTCRNLSLPHAGNAIRVRAEDQPRTFTDRLQGHSPTTAEKGDFIVWRRDDLPAYPLAVVADDHAMGVTHVVRGADLLDNTPRQLHLLSRLGIQAPSYAHIPVLVTESGEKLSKHNGVTALDDQAATLNLAAVLGLLGLDPPAGRTCPARLLEWARPRWRVGRLPRTRAIEGFTALE